MRGEDRRLGAGVVALDVGGGIALGVPELLGLGQRLGVRRARLGHAGEDEVGRAVDDAHDPADVLAGQRLAQRAHDRDAAGHRRLEQQVDPGRLGRGEQLGAVVGQQLLVGGDHRLAGLQRREDQLAGRLDAADHLDDHVDRRGRRPPLPASRVRTPGGKRDRPLPGEAAHRHPADLEPQAGARLDVVASRRR